MAIQVLIERVGKNGYRASSGEPLALSVEAPTREAALAKLKKKLEKRLSKDGELGSVEVGAPENPRATAPARASRETLRPAPSWHGLRGGRSKKLFDNIDRMLAKHYGFTDRELDFIIDSDIKYQIGQAHAGAGGDE
jgi:hypothetical protein